MKRRRQPGANALASRPHVADRLLFALMVATLTIAFVFGGAPIRSGPAFLLFSVTGLITLMVALWRGHLRSSVARPALAFVLLAGILPFLQIVPLPYQLWTSLPGHDLAGSIFQATGLAGQPFSWSVTPVSTMMCAVLVFPLAGMFVAVSGATDDEVDLLLIVLAALIVTGLAVGVVQVATAGRSLSFYQKADHGYLLGFFTNKNHSATLLASGMFVATYLAHRWLRVDTQRRMVAAIGITVLLAAILATNSRAGLLLGSIAAILCGIGMTRNLIRNRRLIGLAAGTFVAVAIVVIGVSRVSNVADRSVERYSEIGQDRRWTIWTDTVIAVKQYAPLGSGLGSFIPVYRTVEPLGSVNPRYANHAHNDYLELALEGGIPALSLVAMFLLLSGQASASLLVDVWRLPSRQATAGRQRSRPTTLDRRTCQALVGSGTSLLILLHSTIDYPLRTMIWSTLLATCLALLLRARGAATRRAEPQEVNAPIVPASIKGRS